MVQVQVAEDQASTSELASPNETVKDLVDDNAHLQPCSSKEFSPASAMLPQIREQYEAIKVMFDIAQT